MVSNVIHMCIKFDAGLGPQGFHFSLMCNSEQSILKVWDGTLLDTTFFSAHAPHLQCKSNTCVQLDQRLVSWPLFACEFSFKGEFWFEAAIFNAVTQKGLQLSQIGMGPLVGLILTTCTQPCTKEIQFRKLNLKPPALLILFTSSLGPLGSASWSLGKES